MATLLPGAPALKMKGELGITLMLEEKLSFFGLTKLFLDICAISDSELE